MLKKRKVWIPKVLTMTTNAGKIKFESMHRVAREGQSLVSYIPCVIQFNYILFV